MSSISARVEQLRPVDAGTSGPGPAGDRRFLFLHIPKTGGTSLLALLANAFGERHLRRLDAAEVSRGAVRRLLASPALRETRCLAGHVPAHAFGGRLDEFQVFTILRDPVERVFSLYRFLRRQRPADLARLGLRRRFSFDDLLASRDPGLWGQVRNGMCRMLCNAQAPSDDRRDLFWQERMPADVIERALATLRHVEFGLTEEMPQTLALVRSLLGLSFGVTEHFENVSGPAGRERSTANLARLMEMNAADLALYHQAQSMFRARMERLAMAAAARSALPGCGVMRLAAGIETQVQDMPGRQGFHQYEPEQGFSWLVGTAPARLAFAASPGRVRLRLRAYRITDAYPVQDIGIAVNGVGVAHAWQGQADRWGVLETEPFTAADLNIVGLSVPFTLPTRFLSPGSPDRRQLSIAVSTVMLTIA